MEIDLWQGRAVPVSQGGTAPEAAAALFARSSLITIFVARSGRQQAAETMSFERKDRRIELTPYSGIF